MADLQDTLAARAIVHAGQGLAELARPLADAVKIAGAHIIMDQLRPEHCEPLAAKLDEAARQLRLFAVRFEDRHSAAAEAVDHQLSVAAHAHDEAHPYDHGLPLGTHVTGLSYRTGKRATGPIMEIGPALTVIDTDAGRITMTNDTVEPAGPRVLDAERLP
ncbi:hypothetical protein [Actinokineospora sp.]|uniref:hypothetical protein n=1 Tax=Actinokineospora sp. TaxID=1872133 RepID=UPI003D6B7955